METISSILAKAEKIKTLAIPDAKYPTGIVIDLSSPAGNVFHIMGTCAKGSAKNSACLMKKWPPITRLVKIAITKTF